MPDPVTILTNTGLARITNAIILGEALTISTIKLGSSAITPVATMTEVPDVVWTGALTSLELDPLDSSLIVARVNVPVEAGTWTVRSAGIFDTDNNLIAIGSLAVTEKLAGYVALTISMVIAVGSEEATFLTLVPSGPYLSAAEKGVPGGLATLGGDGKVPLTQLPAALIGAVKYQGTWDASSDEAPSEDPEQGQYWVVSVAGDTDLDGEDDWQPLDWAIFNGATWQKVDNSDEVGGGGSGGGTIPADTVIAFPGAYANWAALITYLKANAFTGTVVVNVADGTYTNDFLLPDGFTMPNLRIAFGAAVLVDTTGWAPNLFGLATAVFGGVGVHIGCVHGTVTDATPGGALAVNCPLFIRSEWTAGYSNPPVEAGEVGLTFDGFQAGPTIIDTITHGAATFSVLGVTVSSSWSGGAVYDVKYVTDAPTHNIGGQAPFGVTNTIAANFASYSATAAGNWSMGLGSGNIGLGLFTQTGPGFIQAVEGCNLTASLSGGSSYSTYVSGGIGLFFVEAGSSMKIHVATSDVTFVPAAASTAIAAGQGRFEISGAGITLDNAAIGGASLQTVFTVRDGMCNSEVTGNYDVFNHYPNQVIAGQLFTTTQSGVNVQNSALPDAGVELIYGGDITFWNHDAGALIATAELRFTQGVTVGQEIGFYSADGITAFSVTDGSLAPIPGMPTTLAAGVPVFVRVTPAGIFIA